MNEKKLSTNKTKLFVRDCIYTAVNELMKKQNFKEITITQIIDRAGISRMGFYRNFTSKENVVEEFIFEKFVETIEEIEKTRKLNFDVYDIMVTTLKTFQKYAPYVQLFLQQGLEYLMYDCYKKGFFALYNRENTSKFRDYYNQLFIGQLFNLEMTWLKNGMKESPEQLAKIYYKILKLQANKSNNLQ